MGSVLEEQNTADTDSLIKNYEDELTTFLQFRNKDKKEEEEEDGKDEIKTGVKRKRKPEDSASFNFFTNMFLRLMYHISRCMTKTISAGLLKELEYTPNVVLNHGAKTIRFSENAWDSFTKHQHLIECYLEKEMFGKKQQLDYSNVILRLIF